MSSLTFYQRVKYARHLKTEAGELRQWRTVLHFGLMFLMEVQSNGLCDMVFQIYVGVYTK